MKIKNVAAALALTVWAGAAGAAPCAPLSFGGAPLTASFKGNLADGGSTCFGFTLAPGSSISATVFDITPFGGSLTAFLSGGSLGDPIRLPLNTVFSTALGEGGYWLSLGFGGGFAGGYAGTVSQVTAVPEPGTLSMVLAGLGVMGFMARRRGVIGAARPAG